jgi:hypothetical protein
MLNNVVKFQCKIFWGKKVMAFFFTYNDKIMEIFVCSIVENTFFFCYFEKYEQPKVAQW